MRVCAVCVGACGSVYLCAGTPDFSFLLFLLCLLLRLLLLLPYHAVCITPSLKLSSSRFRVRHGTTAAVAQQGCVEHYLLLVCVC